MDTHELCVHNGERSFKCDICNGGFTSKKDLNRHISSVHEGKRPLKCELCGSSFKEKGKLKPHILDGF